MSSQPGTLSPLIQVIVGHDAVLVEPDLQFPVQLTLRRADFSGYTGDALLHAACRLDHRRKPELSPFSKGSPP